jgi:phosphosulfolactate synthase (CoM biosynthesis protein A)
MKGTIKELLDAYTEIETELRVRATRKAKEQGLKVRPEVIGKTAKDMAYFLIREGEK